MPTERLYQLIPNPSPSSPVLWVSGEYKDGKDGLKKVHAVGVSRNHQVVLWNNLYSIEQQETIEQMRLFQDFLGITSPHIRTDFDKVLQFLSKNSSN